MDSRTFSYACQGCYKIGSRFEIKRCGGCGNVRYCSVDCQRADWVNHKPQCKPGRVIDGEKLSNFIMELFDNSPETKSIINRFKAAGNVLEIEVHYPEIFNSRQFTILSLKDYFTAKQTDSRLLHYGLNVSIRIAGDPPLRAGCHINIPDWGCAKCGVVVPVESILRCKNCPLWFCSRTCKNPHSH